MREDGRREPGDVIRPKWAMKIWMMVHDEIIDEKWEYPMDGSQDHILDAIEMAVDNVLCAYFGHEIIDDHCGLPEHRHCLFCMRSEISIRESL